jgi:hypothetical protein
MEGVGEGEGEGAEGGNWGTKREGWDRRERNRRIEEGREGVPHKRWANV